MNINSPEYFIAYKLGSKALDSLVQIVDPQELEDQIRKTGNEVGVAVLDAMQSTAEKIKHPRYAKILKALISLGIWKMLTDDVWRPIVIEYMNELKKELQHVPIEHFTSDSKYWKVNKGWAREKTAKN